MLSRRRHSFSSILTPCIFALLAFTRCDTKQETKPLSKKTPAPTTVAAKPITPPTILEIQIARRQATPTSHGLSVEYPLDETLFPREIPPPTFRWKDSNKASNLWLVSIALSGAPEPIDALTTATVWTPTEAQWTSITAHSLDTPATITIVGLDASAPARPIEILSRAAVTIQTSRDEIGASLFYREVNLPFIDAVKDPRTIRWRYGAISSRRQPPIVLEGLPVCGNCHSFSRDASTIGMDIDYANSKGSYVITRVAPEMRLATSDIITWNDYRKEDKLQTFGLLSQLSPDGRVAISTVKDRSVFVPKPDLAFSQLFFPVKGILAVYDRETKTYQSLPGADDPAYVQSNPSWSPDGKSLLFARADAHEMKTFNKDGAILLTTEECKEFLKEGKIFQFDLYRIPYNDGQGGKAEPLPGASNNGMSNFFARYSPDGKWIVFCKAKSFMLLQPDSELYIMPAQGGGEPRRMRCNTSRMNSWHSWSPNSRWLVFASKANSAYTQLFLTHIDDRGHSTPPVELAHLTAPDRAANIPEFVDLPPDGIAKIKEEFLDDVSFERAGHEFFKAGDKVNAEKSYRKALELNPGNSEVHNRLGFILWNRKQTEEGIAHYEEAIRLNPYNPRAHCNYGMAMIAQKKFDIALTHCARAVEILPEEGSYHAALGEALHSLGKIDMAVEQLLKAIELDPTLERPYNYLGMACYKKKDIDKAIAYWFDSLRLKPDYVDAHYNLGMAFNSRDQLDGAAQHFSEAARLRPKDADIHYDLGVVYFKQRNLIDSIDQFSEAARLKPGNPLPLQYLGTALIMTGNIPEALRITRQAMELARAAGNEPLVLQLEQQLSMIEQKMNAGGNPR